MVNYARLRKVFFVLTLTVLVLSALGLLPQLVGGCPNYPTNPYPCAG